MSDSVKKILVVDDEETFLSTIAERLKLLGFDPLKASNGPEALSLAKSSTIDLAIVDLNMPGMDGLVTLAKLKEIRPDLRSILLTGYGSEKVKQATDAINSAYFEKDHMHSFWDFIKHINQSGNTVVITPPAFAANGAADRYRHSEAFRPAKIEILSDRPLPKDMQASPASPDNRNAFESSERLHMIGETQDMQVLRRNIERVARLDCTVILRGETGTGKELAARIIHASSPRKRYRFLAFNCGCFSSDLLIEELFNPDIKAAGKEIPDADAAVQTGAGGTILLDQIEDMPQKMQLSMLKILDNMEAKRKENIAFFPFDVRILVASRYHLETLVQQGKFREELYHRLNLMELYIPPLRERRDDIPPLARYFIHRHAGEFNKPVATVSEEVLSIFMAYDFPGNVRELEHVIERAVILSDGPAIEAKHLPARFQIPPSGPPAEEGIMTLAEMEKNHIRRALEAAGGNKSKTAELLGISRSALWRKLSTLDKD